MPTTRTKTPLEGVFEPATIHLTRQATPGLTEEGAVRVQVRITNMDESINAGAYSDLILHRWSHFREHDTHLRLTVDENRKLVVTYRVIVENNLVTRAALEQLQRERITLDEAMRLITTLDLFWD